MSLKDDTALLQSVKDKLRITWEHEDERIKNMIARAAGYLNGKCGVSLKFAPDSDEMTLLFERVFYDYNNALERFEPSYGVELRALILKTAADNYAETE